MMKKRFKKSLLALCMVIAMVGVTACGRNNNAGNNNAANDDSNTGDNTAGDNAVEENVGNQTENGGIVDQYNTLLQTETNSDNVYGFIDENITNASESEADQLVSGILGFEDTYEDVDYSRLYAYKNYVSDEVEDFLELMYENQQKPYLSDKGLGVTLDELLDRAEDFEKHITEFPDGITTQPSYEAYCKLMNAAIVGGYDSTNSESGYFTGDAKNRIDGRAVDEYMKFLADEVDDGDDDQVNANTTNGNTASNNNTTNGSTTSNGNTTTSGNSTANGSSNTNGDTLVESTDMSNSTGNSANGTTASGNNATTGNNTGSSSANSNTTGNTTGSTTNGTASGTDNNKVNVGDDSEETFTAPITREIVQEYVDLLVKSKNEITTDVQDFYDNLNKRIAEKFDL
ncbi:hypothetical protein [Anaerosporobacter faecicola]|uniref:hypothetical protein n=1 Tax=Anaerosporobacter faecicola TaxID=2718714 RepID=UPI00143CA2EF|nr:hypothetical protein [Anaerosporobacter faecicola]